MMSKTFTFRCRKVGSIGIFGERVSIIADTLEDAQAEWEKRNLGDRYERCGVYSTDFPPAGIIPLPEESPRHDD